MFAHASFKKEAAAGLIQREGGDGPDTRTHGPLPFHGGKLYKAFVSGRSAHPLPGFSDVSGAFPIRFPCSPSSGFEEDQWKNGLNDRETSSILRSLLF